MNANREYEYPDKNDEATQVGVDASEPYAGYWRKSEDYVLATVGRLLAAGKYDSLIDIGCGAGRLTSRYARYFDRITALDPDEERLRAAAAAFKNQSLSEIECLREKFIEARLQDGSFDVAICSHVIQHIPSHDVTLFLAAIWKVLKKDGILVLLTTHSRKKHNVYLASYLEDGKLVEPVVSELEFNTLCEESSSVLPCCLFSMSRLRQYLRQFKIAQLRVFHALHKKNFIDRVLFRDRVINLPLVRRYCGEDMFVLGVKQ